MLDPVHRCIWHFLNNEIHTNYCKSNNYLLKSHLATWISDSPPYFEDLQTGDRIWTKTGVGDWSSSEPMQWELSPSGGFHDLDQAVEFRQLLLSLARKSAGISICLGAVFWKDFGKGEAMVGRFRCADWRFWKSKLFLPRQVLISICNPSSWVVQFMSSHGHLQLASRNRVSQADYRQIKNKPLSDIEFRPMQAGKPLRMEHLTQPKKDLKEGSWDCLRLRNIFWRLGTHTHNNVCTSLI